MAEQREHEVLKAESLAELLVQARKRRRLTQGEVARKVGYASYVAVLRIERGRGRPGEAYLARWLETLKLTAEEREQAVRLWFAEASAMRQPPGSADSQRSTPRFGLDAEVERILGAHPELRRVYGASSPRQQRELRAALNRRVREELFRWAEDAARELTDRRGRA